MKYVFPTSEIPHLWAHQTQDSARNSRGNLYFRGATIYSYRDSWPLAHIHTAGKGKTARVLVLTNSNKYSRTTAGHQSSVDRACSHMANIACPYLLADAGYSRGDHAKNLQYFAQSGADLLKKAQHGLRTWGVNYQREKADKLHLAETNYRAFFKIRGKQAPFPGAAWEAALARVTAIENPDPVRDAKRFKARELREVRNAARLEKLKAEYVTLQAQASAELAEGIDAWRNGGTLPHSSFCLPDTWTKADRRAVTGSSWSYYVQGRVLCMLRVNGDQIETSQGARIPLDHAPRIWRLVSACVNTGREYKRNGHTEHAGSYPIDSVSATGELRAGCHVISYAEIQRLAATLNLA